MYMCSKKRKGQAAVTRNRPRPAAWRQNSRAGAAQSPALDSGVQSNIAQCAVSAG